MSTDDHKRQEYFKRIRRLKRIMRPLPRRATVHRYPVLKWFAATARKRSDLWSFRKEYVIPAIYIGSILALLPPPTPQMPLTILLAFAVRCNVMIAAALTFITNPFTIAPLYYANYKVGKFILGTFWHPDLIEDVSPEVVEMLATDSANTTETIMTWIQKIFDVWTPTAVGGLIVGLGFGIAIHIAYLILLHYHKKRNADNPFGFGRLRNPVPHSAADSETAEITQADTFNEAEDAATESTSAKWNEALSSANAPIGSSIDDAATPDAKAAPDDSAGSPRQ